MNTMQEPKRTTHRPEMPSSRESFEYFQFNPEDSNSFTNNADNYAKYVDRCNTSNMYRADVNNEMRLHSQLLSETATPAELIDSVNSSDQLLTFGVNNNADRGNINQVKMKTRMMMMDDDVASNKIRNNIKSNYKSNNGVYTKIANDENTSEEVYSGPYSLRSSWELLKRKAQHCSVARWMLLWMSFILCCFAVMMIATAFRLPSHRAAGITYTFARENVRDEADWTPLPPSSSSEPNSNVPSTENIASLVGGTLNLLLNPPSPMELIEYGLLWCGVPVFAAVVCGVLRVMYKGDQLRCIYAFECLFISSVCALFICLGLKEGYLGGSYDGISHTLRQRWQESQISADGREALWLISAAFKCSGYDVCCEGETMTHRSLSYSLSTLSRSTEEEDYESSKVYDERYNTSELSTVKLVANQNEKQRLSNKLCFREVVNNTLSKNKNSSYNIIRNDQDGIAAAFSTSTTRYVSIDNGTDITELVEQQCRYYINSTRTHNIAFTTECGPILLGRVSTSVAFALSAIFSVGVFCAVNYWLSRVISKDNA